ncbi:sn-glycerol-3-phosphate import ATP-binding protein UgpC [Piscirickettsia salmonis]|uniref:ABC transporter family protein n=1 Tax=Piscirickettsia salmonis TaxID=1238 RepID=A0A1L6TA67_PISSA|nr:ABC transporter family protein [Piscirickettsia salmonis LF-89 = ATCC VR-1361]ALB21961.1 ABC transporter family protein [Piscirickettsia salmonis]ALY02119.1 ABC transporter family protein [Piscirickettsia salmonis]AMA41633.1 ABC transporter family protein [Piscirickettsia salmonis]AOS34116.1 ABC transporter family protein [Piscirickettsia salmonis]
MFVLELKALTKSYGMNTVLSKGALRVAQGEFCLISGKSESGKSVLLKVINGQEECTDGSILIDNQTINNAQKNNFVLILANYSLHPESTVYENLAYRLYLKGVKRQQTRQHIDVIAKKMNLTHLLKSYPKDLNIFSYIRVVFARALVQQARFYLLDEPWRDLPCALKKRLARLLCHLQQEGKFSVIYTNFLLLHDESQFFKHIDQWVKLENSHLIPVHLTMKQES